MSLIRHQRRTFLLYKETWMQSGQRCLWKLARQLRTLLQWWHKWERTQTSGVCDRLRPLTILCLRTHLVITRHPEDGHDIAQMNNTTTKGRLVIVLPPMPTVPSWSSKASVMILFRNMLKRVGESRHPCRTPTVVRNQSPMLPLKRTAPCGLIIQVFNDSDKVGTDVVLLYGCPQSCMPNPVECLLKVCENMV